MFILQLLIFFLALIVFALSAYLCVLTFGAWVFKKITKEENVPLSMAIVIPAHNQESLIDSTLDSISQSDYQQSLVDIFVIADNCSDSTAKIAEDKGARVFQRNDPAHPGKDQALNWFFRNHEVSYEHYDGVVIIDAGTVLDKNFLSHISSSLAHPKVEVVQGFYGVTEPEANWRSKSFTAGLNVYHHVRPAGRNAFGGSARLQDSGMAFIPNILKKYCRPCDSPLENLEFSSRLILDDILIHYNPEAIVLGNMSANKEPIKTKSMPWEIGQRQILQKYGLDLLRKILKKPKFLYFDSLMDLLIPQLTILFSSQFLLLILSCLFFPGLIFDALLCLLITFICVLSGLILRNSPFSIWISVLGTAFYLLWELILFFKNRPRVKH